MLPAVSGPKHPQYSISPTSVGALVIQCMRPTGETAANWPTHTPAALQHCMNKDSPLQFHAPPRYTNATRDCGAVHAPKSGGSYDFPFNAVGTGVGC